MPKTDDTGPLAATGPELIQSIEDLIARMRAESSFWPEEHPRWFRGEPDVPTALLPRLYRVEPYPNENQLLQNFRAMAPSFASRTPARGDTDQWLCLAQHVGLPTRLLDWTENALFAAYCALRTPKPVVWMLDPIALNALSASDSDAAGGELPLPWHKSRSPSVINIGSINIRGAWENDAVGVPLPVASVPTHVHPRMAAQRSRFTVWGGDKRSLRELVSPMILRRFPIDPDWRTVLLKDLRMLGIQEASAFPDLDGLARELAELYGVPTAGDGTIAKLAAGVPSQAGTVEDSTKTAIASTCAAGQSSAGV